MKNAKSGLASVVVAIILLAVLAGILAYVFSQFGEQKPLVEVVSSLEPSTVKEGERAMLVLNFKNVDLKTHEITVTFSVGPHISIYEGNELPLQQNRYSFVLEASNPSEQRAFGVSGTLETGTLSAEYLIAFNVSVDGQDEQKHWSEPILTIQKN